jgi:predicted branched-subunit amino acid permease
VVGVFSLGGMAGFPIILLQAMVFLKQKKLIFYWIAATVVGVLLGVIVGILTKGMLTVLPIIVLQIAMLQKYQKNLMVWMTSNLITSLMIGFLLAFVMVFYVAAADFYPFSLSVLMLTGIIYGLGTAIAFGGLYRKPRVFLG